MTLDFFIFPGIPVVVAAAALSPIWVPVLGSKFLPVRPSAKLMIEVASKSKGWSFDQFCATHETGLCVWIANDASSAAVSFHSRPWPSNVGGGNVETNVRERRLIFKALMKQRDNQLSDEARERLQAWAGNVQRYADNVVQMKGRA